MYNLYYTVAASNTELTTMTRLVYGIDMPTTGEFMPTDTQIGLTAEQTIELASPKYTSGGELQPIPQDTYTTNLNSGAFEPIPAGRSLHTVSQFEIEKLPKSTSAEELSFVFTQEFTYSGENTALKKVLFILKS